MRDAIDFARFTTTEAAYIVEVLRSAYTIRTLRGEEDELLGDFIAALDECDCIDVVEDEGLIDEA